MSRRACIADMRVVTVASSTSARIDATASSTERSDKSLLSATVRGRGEADPPGSSCFGRVFLALRRRCELTALLFLYGLPAGVSSPLLDLWYGRRTSEEGVQLEAKTQIALQLGQVVAREKGFDLVEALEEDLGKGRKRFERWVSQPKHPKVRVESVAIDVPAGGGG